MMSRRTELLRIVDDTIRVPNPLDSDLSFERYYNLDLAMLDAHALRVVLYGCDLAIPVTTGEAQLWHMERRAAVLAELECRDLVVLG